VGLLGNWRSDSSTCCCLDVVEPGSTSYYDASSTGFHCRFAAHGKPTLRLVLMLQGGVLGIACRGVSIAKAVTTAVRFAWPTTKTFNWLGVLLVCG